MSLISVRSEVLSEESSENLMPPISNTAEESSETSVPTIETPEKVVQTEAPPEEANTTEESSETSVPTIETPEKVVQTEAPPEEANTTEEPKNGFADLGLSEDVLKAVLAQGYTEPTPIQSSTIPHVLAERDVLAQAQTGTGKTAAFALPLLTRMRIDQRRPQVLVLAPTRELAIQVAEAFKSYGSKLKGFRVLPIYGGQGYDTQLRELKKGVHVVVGTPGRVMDHLRRGTLDLSELNTLVLDEADEMLRMGFVDDVEWILQQTAEDRQLLFFSATMPQTIRRLTRTYLEDPIEIFTPVQNVTAETVSQKYWLVRDVSKVEGLQRFLETEDTDGVIIFVRTRQDTLDLSEQLSAKGYAVAPLNGDIPQNHRERTVQHLKDGKLELLVATDVAARGLDIQRISHVINYDIPHDPEAYVHRIGRTGRAGREGTAILFVWPREQRSLKQIERVTRQKLSEIELPTSKDINTRRIERFKTKISEHLEHSQIDFYRQLLTDYMEQEEQPETLDIMAALSIMAQGGQPLLMKDDLPRRKREEKQPRRAYQGDEGRSYGGGERYGRERPGRERPGRGAVADYSGSKGTYRISVGHKDRVRPGQIVGAIANEGGIDSAQIGEILLYETFATVELPVSMEKQLQQSLTKTRVAGRLLKLSRFDEDRPLPSQRPERASSDRPDRADRYERSDRPDRPDRADRSLGSKVKRSFKKSQGEAPPARSFKSRRGG